MRRKRNSKLLTEGVYDFYEAYEGVNTADKILNYYVDKIRKNGKGSLTKKEVEVFDNARRGKLNLETPQYKRNKLTGDIERNAKGEAIRLDDTEKIIPGVPFLTSKGRGLVKKEIINARCYWNVDDPCKYYYAFIIANKSAENPSGLVIYKTHSKEDDKVLGSFIIPKSTLIGIDPEDLWNNVNDKYDKGIILDKNMFQTFVRFDDLFHNSKKESMPELLKIYEILKKYPGGK